MEFARAQICCAEVSEPWRRDATVKFNLFIAAIVTWPDVAFWAAIVWVIGGSCLVVLPVGDCSETSKIRLLSYLPTTSVRQTSLMSWNVASCRFARTLHVHIEFSVPTNHYWQQRKDCRRCCCAPFLTWATTEGKQLVTFPPCQSSTRSSSHIKSPTARSPTRIVRPRQFARLLSQRQRVPAFSRTDRKIKTWPSTVFDGLNANSGQSGIRAIVR